jgi:hypothetical protein
MILVAVAILVGVFVAATGRGGELAYEQPDHAPLDLGPVSPSDVAMLRPPTALWGYNMQVTDEALDRIAQALRDRDVTIAYLQQRLAGSALEAAALEPTVMDPSAMDPAAPPPGALDPRTPAAAADQPAPAAADQPGEVRLPQSSHQWFGPQQPGQ